MKCIILDERKDFLSDVEMRLILEEEMDVEILTTLSSTERLMNVIKTFRPDTVVVCANLIETQEDWNIGSVNVVAYASDAAGEKLIEEYGLPSYGIVKTSLELLNKINNNVLKSGKSDGKKPKETPHKREEENDNYEEHLVRPVQKKKKPVVQEPVYEEDDYEDEEEEPPVSVRKPAQKQRQPQKQEKNQPQHQPQRTSRQVKEEYEEPEYDDEDEEDDEYKDVQQKKSAVSRRSSESSMMSTQRKNKRMMPKEKKKAKVVTVYAAKGGVGKTTVSSELAVYLSLTYVGRGKLRVCLVDYNIDFGDVRSVLGFPVDEGADMSLWAMDIRDRLSNGESPEEIEYSKDEIETYLQTLKDTDMYALLAPLSHEESMDIGREELDIMLRNIINNGGFDFVVCDTGNNTRDSTVYALMAADTILLVSTQDATAATCNSSSLEALQKFGLDMDKVKMVINLCRSTKETGISVKEVEEVFVYPCIARIPYDNSVIRANNLSVPIVYQPKNDFTAGIRKIVAFLLGKPAVDTEAQSKVGKFLSKLFGRK